MPFTGSGSRSRTAVLVLTLWTEPPDELRGRIRYVLDVNAAATEQRLAVGSRAAALRAVADFIDMFTAVE
jgi:hypothetical protein